MESPLTKSNRVPWSCAPNLSQVKEFAPANYPSKVFVESQHHHLQSMTPRMSNSNDGHLNGLLNQLKNSNYVKSTQIPQIKWRCPPKFVLNDKWLVAAGEESEGTVYPHLSVVPPSPSVDASHDDDNNIPLIPTTPIEEAAPPPPPPPKLPRTPPPPNNSMNPQIIPRTQNSPKPKSPPAVDKKSSFDNLESNVVVAAAAALAAINKSKEQGSLIDTDLLIQFLSHPKMIEKLINETPLTSSKTGTLIGEKSLTPALAIEKSNSKLGEITSTSSNGEVAIKKPSIERIGTNPIFAAKPELKPSNEHGGTHASTQFTGINSDLSKVQRLINAYGTPDDPENGNFFRPKPDVSVPPVKDFNYYKSLIKQHGEMLNGKTHNFSTQKLVKNVKSSEQRIQTKKHCLFFNSPRGCRNGFGCPYLHDVSEEWRTGGVFEAPGAKRMKIGAQISGGT